MALPLKERKLTPPKETPAYKAGVVFCLPPNRQGSIAQANVATVGDLPASAKVFATLAAEFALLGHALSEGTSADGRPCLVVSRWGFAREFGSLAAAREFLHQVGGAAPWPLNVTGCRILSATAKTKG